MSNVQCAYWFLTIHQNAESYSIISDILKEQEEKNPNLEYSYIYHSADEDDNVEHIHLVLYFKGSVKRFNTMLNMFLGSHIEQTNSQRYKRCIQYLIHKNDISKKQYLQKEIISNIDIVKLSDILNGSGYDFELFEEHKINDYIYENTDLSMNYFINRFGVSAISKYYFILKDLLKEHKELLLSMNMRKKTKEEKAFEIYSKNIKQEFQLMKYYHNISGDLEDYRQQLYLDFLDAVEKGYINIDEILESR